MSGSVYFDNNQAPVRINQLAAPKRPSVIGKLIELLAVNFDEDIDLSRSPVDVKEKIQFNDLKTHQWLFDSYAENSVLVEKSISELDLNIHNGSKKLKKQIRRFYRKALSDLEILTPDGLDLAILRQRSSEVIDDVFAMTKAIVEGSSDLLAGFYQEDINLGVELIVTHSIVECIVLENPNDYD